MRLGLLPAMLSTAACDASWRTSCRHRYSLELKAKLNWFRRCVMLREWLLTPRLVCVHVPDLSAQLMGLLGRVRRTTLGALALQVGLVGHATQSVLLS